MRYIKYTYVDSKTGISVATAPAINGPAFPAISGLEFTLARESQYPTDVPEFFGTCDDGADLTIDGFIAEYSQQEWEQLQADEMRARNPVPHSITMRQARRYLLNIGRLQDVNTAIDNLTEPQRTAAQIDWEYSQVVDRDSEFVLLLAPVLGWDSDDLDTMFIEADKLTA